MQLSHMTDILYPTASKPHALIVAIPTLNEAVHIECCVHEILEQIGPNDRIVVCDGGSVDATVEIARRIGAIDRRVSVVHNPERIQSAAVNRVAALAADDVELLLRVDAHATYPKGFVDGLLKAHDRVGAASVVVPMRAIGKTPFQRGVAAAQNSVLGNGGSLHRNGAGSRFVDHGHHALFDIAAFRAIGGYDETFTHNEDFELDHRLRVAGGRIFMLQDGLIGYFPRSTPIALARQYFRHGQGRARTILKHRLRPKVRQLLPVIIFVGSLISVPASLIFPPFALLPLLYVTLCLTWGAVSALRSKDATRLFVGPAAIIMHMAWACGFVRHMARAFARRSRTEIPEPNAPKNLGDREPDATQRTNSAKTSANRPR